MLQSSYKFSSSISAKGKENSTESLSMTLKFEQYKKWYLIQTLIICNNNFSNIIITINTIVISGSRNILIKKLIQF